MDRFDELAEQGQLARIERKLDKIEFAITRFALFFLILVVLIAVKWGVLS
jgi:hypothetical protein